MMLPADTALREMSRCSVKTRDHRDKTLIGYLLRILSRCSDTETLLIYLVPRIERGDDRKAGKAANSRRKAGQNAWKHAYRPPLSLPSLFAVCRVATGWAIVSPDGSPLTTPIKTIVVVKASGGATSATDCRARELTARSNRLAAFHRAEHHADRTLLAKAVGNKFGAASEACRLTLATYALYFARVDARASAQPFSPPLICLTAMVNTCTATRSLSAAGGIRKVKGGWGVAEPRLRRFFINGYFFWGGYENNYVFSKWL